MNTNYLSREQALSKAKHYCAYQERCHQEVMGKLSDWGLKKKEADEILSELIEEGYLNEERFALTYAGSKFRTRQWGKRKIRHALAGKNVSDYCIRLALGAIEDEDYQSTLRKLFETKMSALQAEKNTFIKRNKVQDYLLQKGYEPDLIRELVSSIN